VAETAVKRLPCCGFRRTGKAMGTTVISVGGGYVEKKMFVSRFEYHIFYVLYPFVTYLVTLPRTFKRQVLATSSRLSGFSPKA
jgi:hypothetical protein